MSHDGEVPKSKDDPLVQSFLTKWTLLGPVYLQYKDYGYEPAWCHISAQHRVITDGGKRVHGWALWQFGPDLVAEHHSVWETEDGNLVDVTPPSNGGTQILFVRDDNARIDESDGSYLLFTDGEHKELWGVGDERVPPRAGA